MNREIRGSLLFLSSKHTPASHGQQEDSVTQSEAAVKTLHPLPSQRNFSASWKSGEPD